MKLMHTCNDNASFQDQTSYKNSQINKPTKVTNSRKLNVVVINQYNNEKIIKELDDLTNKCLYTH